MVRTRPYPYDLADEEWVLLEPHHAPQARQLGPLKCFTLGLQWRFRALLQNNLLAMVCC